MPKPKIVSSCWQNPIKNSLKFLIGWTYISSTTKFEKSNYNLFLATYNIPSMIGPYLIAIDLIRYQIMSLAIIFIENGLYSASVLAALHIAYIVFISITRPYQKFKKNLESVVVEIISLISVCLLGALGVLEKIESHDDNLKILLGQVKNFSSLFKMP